MRYPPESSRSAVTVGPSDLERLEDEEFLNDTVIDFYMRWGGQVAVGCQVVAACKAS
jgi:Ulp1 family protease